MIDVSTTQMYRFLDGTRGLSQDRLDALCSTLNLLVEAPTALIFSHRPGGMITGKRRVDRPRPPARAESEVIEDGQSSPPPYYPSSEESIDES